MKSIQRRFKIYQNKNPYLGDYVNLMKTVYAQKYSKDTISRWFPKLVNVDEYNEADKRYLIRTLCDTSNMTQGHKK